MVLKILPIVILHPICKYWCIAHKLDHLNFPLPFFVTLLVFLFFLSYKAHMAKVIHLLLYYVISIIILNVSISCKHILDSYN
jgi:hypothetical protein